MLENPACGQVPEPIATPSSSAQVRPQNTLAQDDAELTDQPSLLRIQVEGGTVAINEAARHELYTRLEELLGQQPTSTLMSLLPPVGWADVATKDDLRMLGLELRKEIAGLRTDIANGHRRLALTLVGAMVSISGLTFAANAVF